MKQVTISGIGSYLPAKVLTNKDLEKIVETNEEWIFTRTGIRERRIAAENEMTSDMAVKAAEKAIAMAGITAADVDMIVVATMTPDMPFPCTAAIVQGKLGARNAFCFDLEAACSGFIYAMETARNYVAAGSVKTALVIGAEKISAIMDWSDRGTCILFGDGAGAAILQESKGNGSIRSTVMASDGTLGDLLSMPGGGVLNPATHKSVDAKLHFLKMNGKEVFKHAVRCMGDVGKQALEKCGLTYGDVDCLIPHQANIRIIEAISERVKAPPEKVFINLDKVGNISAASIPLALDEAMKSGKIKKGDIILTIAFGSGFTWGATVLEWGI
jgi:3-oxoacyl-[acyl-carrier-protein] synthase III